MASVPEIMPETTEDRQLALADAIVEGDLTDFEEPQYGDDTARRRILARERAEQSEDAMENYLWWLSLPAVRFEEESNG